MSKPSIFSGTALFLLLACCSLPQARAAGPVPVSESAATADAQDQRFDRAMAAYERNHWAQAFAQFRDLGLQGHGEAARLALQMARFGPRLYGQALVLTLAQSASLQQLQSPAAAGQVLVGR